MSMAVRDVASLGSFVLQLAGQLQELGENWYKASKDWEDFPRKVENLRELYHVWHNEVEKFGVESDPILVTPLELAKVLLEKEEAELKRRNEFRETSCVVGCWPKLSMTVFPGTIGQRLQSVIDAFENIPNTQTKREEARATAEKALLYKPRALVFRNDDRYVPLEESESAVYSALEVLENRDGPTVVLLHGGPGKGKSTLARHAAVHYENLRRKGKSEEDQGPQFHQVIYLECGQNATPLLKQIELLQWLGIEATVDQVDQGSDCDTKISEKLRSALKSRKVLIIFDDVGDKEFLRRMLDLCGDGVRCLVTSQNGSLCWGLQCSATEIRIEDVKPDLGRKILASYVFGKRNEQLHERVLSVANEIVKECQGNPLALASVSTALRKHPDDLTEWERARETLLTLLESEDTPEILNRKYPRSFVSAIQLPLKDLDDEGLKLLILVYLCSPPSVPEEVVSVMHQRFQGKSRTFQVLRNELEDRELIKITSQCLGPENRGNEKSWSVHSLQRQFIRENAKVRQLQENMLASILVEARVGVSSGVNTETGVDSEIVTEFSTEEDSMVSIALCSLYFDREFAWQAASKMGVDHDKFEEKFNNMRRNAIEPVTRLLGQPASQRWTPNAQALTKQVFLEYICNVRLHNKGIVHLLSSKMSTLPMSRALSRVALMREKQLLTTETQGIVTTLVGLLRSWDNSDSFESSIAAMAIATLSQDPAHKGFIISSGVLEETGKLVLSNPPLIIKVALTTILSGLACPGEPGALSDNDVIVRILKMEGLLEQQIIFLSREIDPLLQEAAASLIINLASSEEGRLQILDSGAPQLLVSSLSKDDSPHMHTSAAWALANLGFPEKPALKIFHLQGAIEGLVNALSKDSNPELQEHAARALANISASSSEEVKLGILDSGAGQQLVNSLSKDVNPKLQFMAAGALTLLAISSAKEVKFRILSLGALQPLVNFLSKSGSPELQFTGGMALGALRELSLEEVILELFDAGLPLEQFVSIHAKISSERLRSWIAEAFNRGERESMKWDDGTLSRLGQAFLNLGDGNLGERGSMTLHDGTLPRRTTLLAQESLQGEVARALAYMENTDLLTCLGLADWIWPPT